MHFFAILLATDFYRLRSYTEDLLVWPTYDDFVLERDGAFLGLSWAGMNVVQVEAPLALFERWLERTGASADLKTLDDFAMRRWVRANYPNWVARPARGGAASSGEPSGCLDIPLHPLAFEDGRRLSSRASDVSANDLAADIARECLDPVA